ncbi:hypothetical protein HPB51_019857 [Rhipicephalus microplus]|uniref:Uncharacterized protein n=1 Tax=Rhipicephalus microplus TaxID=6941 RepID=A0A9J6DCG3_RHIMP|nr:hypothetical protein HPB51_019857 [Rhipicephalus microplus]
MKRSHLLLSAVQLLGDKFLQWMADFLEQEFLAEQVRSIDQLQRLITQLQNMETGLGEFLLDQQLRA